MQRNAVTDSKRHGIHDPEGVVHSAQAKGLVVDHKSWLTSEPGSLLVGAMDDSSYSASRFRCTRK